MGLLAAMRGKFGAGGGAVALLLGLALLATGCERSSAAAERPRLATANSYLESAVHDLLPAGAGLVRLAAPGMCPGHFDLHPGRLEELRQVRLLLRFDFQSGLDEKLAPLTTGRIAPVHVPGGMCVPASYAATLDQVSEALVRAGMLAPDVAAARCAARARELAGLADECRARVRQAGWAGAAVASSTHQAEFCTALGLDVRATFSGADAATIAELNGVLGVGPRIQAVIANEPEGRRLADALGERLGARVVVFANFPTPVPSGNCFDAMVRENVTRLLAVP